MCSLYTDIWSYAIGWCLAGKKQQNKLVERKEFVAMRIERADLKNNFCSRVLRLSVLP